MTNKAAGLNFKGPRSRLLLAKLKAVREGRFNPFETRAKEQSDDEAPDRD